MIYFDEEIELIEDYVPYDGAAELKHLAKGEDFCATPGDANWVWCRWPNGKIWKHWREQLNETTEQ